MSRRVAPRQWARKAAGLVPAGLLVLSLLVAAPVAGQAPATPPPGGTTPAPPGAANPATPATAVPVEITKLLQRLPYPGFEPRLRWGWDPIAFEPLAHPVPEDFDWRLGELSKRNLPKLARARLNLELAFLGAVAGGEAGAAGNGAARGGRGAATDSLDAGSRARLARQYYGELLSERPGHPELLTDLGDLFRFLGEPDSALALYRQAGAGERPPARLFMRMANAELEHLAARPDSAAEERFRAALEQGARYFRGAAPTDSIRAARFHLERGRYRIDRAILETRADQLSHPERWQTAGADSLFTLLARVVTPETRKAFQAAAELDTNLAEAHGLLGSVVTGQILLPLTARGLLLRGEVASTDSLAAGLWRLLAERNVQRGLDAQYAAANLNRCELLEPGRYPRVRMEQARLALLMGDADGAAGLWRSLGSRDPQGLEEYAAELYTVHRLEPFIAAGDTVAGGGAVPVDLQMLRMLDPAGGGVSADRLALLGTVRGSLGRADEARRDLLRAAALDSTLWRARLGLAGESRRRLDAPAAEPHLRWAGRHFTDMDDNGRGIYCAAVGLLYRARLDEPNGRRWLAEAARFCPLDPFINEALRQAGTAPPRG